MDRVRGQNKVTPFVDILIVDELEGLLLGHLQGNIGKAYRTRIEKRKSCFMTPQCVLFRRCVHVS